MIIRFITALVLFLAPWLLIAFWKIHQINRELSTEEGQSRSFVPRAAPVGLAFLKLSGILERRYLQQQLKSGAYLLAFGSWFFTFIFALPVIVPAHAEKWFNKSTLLWFEFLRNGSNCTQFISMALFGCVFLAVAPLRFQADARFYRTRPIRISFLFWSRVLCILMPLLLAAAMGMAIATLLLLALHGPVWQHLPVHIPRVLDADDGDIAQEYRELLLTSAPRVFLSVLTTIALFFTGLLALAMIPFLRERAVGSSPTAITPPKVLFVMAFVPLIVAFAHLGSFHLPAVLFIYTNFGPPPPYLFALVPVALSLSFLVVARIFYKRLEI